mmetsp:Transcript_12608/g.17980  ORF Transcript_12608/g.17980 Transcript_12608/m.17980 type:complete len:302 (+) Transcript_12608:1604-2509(+)
MVSNRKSKKQSSAERNVNRCGTVPSPMMAKKFPENVDWSGVFLYRLFKTTVATASLLSSTTTRMPSLSDSSLRSAMPSIFFSFTSVAIFSMSAALLTWYGSWVMTMAFRFFLEEEDDDLEDDRCSTWVMARTTIPPFPVLYNFRASEVPSMDAPVGKSGAGTMSKSRSSASGGESSSRLCVSAMEASMSSLRLCGGTLVAIPTAIPAHPLRRRRGSLAGRTMGSISFPSKLGMKSTVSRCTSCSRASDATLVRRHSVYRMAAAGSLSMEPKFPWPSMRSVPVEKSWARRTNASYTAVSPCG